jgi:hypothetical protein
MLMRAFIDFSKSYSRAHWEGKEALPEHLISHNYHSGKTGLQLSVP